jgi:hypothetical protein
MIIKIQIQIQKAGLTVPSLLAKLLPIHTRRPHSGKKCAAILFNWTVGGSVDTYVSVKTLYIPNYKITSEIGIF